MSTTLTSKGQVTIPKAVRDQLDLKPGSKVEFRLNDAGEVVVRKSHREPSDTNRFDKLLGHAGPGLSTDELMKLLRGDD